MRGKADLAVLLWMHIGLGALVMVQGQDGDTSDQDGNTEDDSGSSNSTASIIGFSVVLSLLMLAVCIVTFLCFRYGTCKCVFKKQSREHASATRRNRSFIPGLSQRKSEQNLQSREPNKMPTAGRIHGVTNPSFSRSGSSYNHDPPPSTPTNTTQNIVTPLCIPHYAVQGAEQPQILQQRGLGYPYQPCKSPKAKLHYDLASPAVLVSDQSISTSSRRADMSGCEVEGQGPVQGRYEDNLPSCGHNTEV